MTPRLPGNGHPKRLQEAAGSTIDEAAETKRLQARRRFLRYGVTGISVLITANRVNAQSITATMCAQNIADDFPFLPTGFTLPFIKNNFGYFTTPEDCDFIENSPAMQQMIEEQQSTDQTL